MNPIELLNEKDRGLIKDYIKAFGGGSDFYYNFESRFQGIDKVMQSWNCNKGELLRLLGNNLILHKPITYKMPSFELYDKYYAEIDNAAGVYYRHIKKVMVGAYNGMITPLRKKVYGEDYDYYLVSFNDEAIDYNSVDYKLFQNLNEIVDFISFTLFQPAVLVENKYSSTSKTFTLPNGETFKVNNGMRPMKIIHKFFITIPNIDEKCQALGYSCAEELFNEFRIWHSKLFNQAAFTGELCLSIHPLDFMTMSDNAHKWNSCMRWNNYFGSGAGDYRTGTLECMNSPHIIIAYLHNPETHLTNATLDNIPNGWEWNSKKWRELFIVYPDVITEIKGYPYQDKHLTDVSLDWIKDLARANMGWDYDEKVTTSEPLNMSDGTQIVITPQTNYFMYNDFGTLKAHKGYVNYERLLLDDPDTWWKRSHIDKQEHLNILVDLPYDGYATCMCCGGDIDEIEENSSRVLCDNCSCLQRCPYCGEYFDGDGYYVADFEDPICESCYENDTYYDDINDENRISSSECMCLELRYYDHEEGRWVRHSRDIYTRSPSYGYNEGYWEIFSEEPNYDADKYIYYVTPDIIKDMEAACSIFHIRGALREQLLALVPAL